MLKGFLIAPRVRSFKAIACGIQKLRSVVKDFLNIVCRKIHGRMLSNGEFEYMLVRLCRARGDAQEIQH